MFSSYTVREVDGLLNTKLHFLNIEIPDQPQIIIQVFYMFDIIYVLHDLFKIMAGGDLQ